MREKTKVSITIRELLEAQGSISKIMGDNKLPLPWSYWMGRTQDVLENEHRIVEKQRKDLIKKYAESTVTGEVKTNEQGLVQWKEGGAKSFTVEWEEFVETTHYFELWTIKLVDLYNIERKMKEIDNNFCIARPIDYKCLSFM